MEKLLVRLARQLDAVDEASLMSLWSKYATLSGRFEPTARWEEAALIFSLIQAKRWKNQLFNYYWSQQSKLREAGPGATQQGPAPDLAPDFTLERANAADAAQSKRCRVLAFTPALGDATSPAGSDGPAGPGSPGKPNGPNSPEK